MGATGSAGLALVLLLAAYQLGDLGRVDAVEVQVYPPGTWQRWPFVGRQERPRTLPAYIQLSLRYLSDR